MGAKKKVRQQSERWRSAAHKANKYHRLSSSQDRPVSSAGRGSDGMFAIEWSLHGIDYTPVLKVNPQRGLRRMKASRGVFLMAS